MDLEEERYGNGIGRSAELPTTEKDDRGGVLGLQMACWPATPTAWNICSPERYIALLMGQLLPSLPYIVTSLTPSLGRRY